MLSNITYKMKKMKKLYFTLLGILFVSMIVNAQTSGTLSVSVYTSNTGNGAEYKPKNIFAIWIEDSNGSFVKTLMAYADERKSHLTYWKASTAVAGSIYNRVDAITGATLANHNTRIASWDGTDYNQVDVNDGTYTVRMELTDKDITGNSSSFDFIKGNAEEVLAPANEPSFSDISIHWEPLVSSTNKMITSNLNISVFPNPTDAKILIKGVEVVSIDVLSIDGTLLLSSHHTNEINIAHLTSGIYILKINAIEGVAFEKVIKE